MGKKKSRRHFTREFKVEAVKLITEKGLTVAAVARDLDIAENLLHRWKRQFHEDPGFALMKKSDQQAEELRRLRRELAIAQQERDILKKAAAYFAKESQ